MREKPIPQKGALHIQYKMSKTLYIKK